ncbi:MAG: PASTA domain-containing protein [Vulcanimicrobiota bacterium]
MCLLWLAGSGLAVAQRSGSVLAPEPGRKMPPLVGQSARTAGYKLEGFRVRLVEVQVDRGEGKILFQNPAPGSPLTRDREIVLHVGVARQQVLLPDYESEARVPRHPPSKWTGPLCLLVLLAFSVGLVQMVRRWRPEDWEAVESPRVELDEKSG